FAADHVALLLLVAFPGFYRNLTQGQNGFLTAALLGGGLLLLERRPWLAGLVLGLLSYKPHLGALVFVALLAGRQTRALGGALVSTGITAVVALAAFGPETYLQFFEDIPHASALLYDQALPLHKMHTLSSALLLLGVPALAAKLLQAAFSLAVVAAVVWLWRRSGRPYLRFAALGIGVLAATPFAFDYD